MAESSSEESDFEEVAQKRFKPLDEAELENVQNGGRQRSKYSENWAEHLFKDWLKAENRTELLSAADLFEGGNIQALVNDLSSCILQARKLDGTLYKPKSLEGLVRGFGRLICGREEQRVVESGCDFIPFQILTNPRFKKLIVAGNEVVERSIKARVGRDIQKSSILTAEEEAHVLAHPTCQINSPQGINFRMAHFCICNFFIRGQKELRNVNIEDFELVDLPSWEVLRYKQGHSKNYKFTLQKAGIEQHRKLVDCHILDVIETFKELQIKRPKVWKKKYTDPPHTMFLAPKVTFHFDDDVWFQEGAVGQNTLAKYTERMTTSLPDMKRKKFSNKSARSTGISRMASALVLNKDGMDQTGHKD